MLLTSSVLELISALSNESIKSMLCTISACSLRSGYSCKEDERRNYLLKFMQIEKDVSIELRVFIVKWCIDLIDVLQLFCDTLWKITLKLRNEWILDWFPMSLSQQIIDFSIALAFALNLILSYSYFWRKKWMSEFTQSFRNINAAAFLGCVDKIRSESRVW